jgi:hypothetical protein
VKVDQLSFEGADEALGHRVVVGIRYPDPIGGSRPSSLSLLENSTEVY